MIGSSLIISVSIISAAEQMVNAQTQITTQTFQILNKRFDYSALSRQKIMDIVNNHNWFIDTHLRNIQNDAINKYYDSTAVQN